VVAAVIFLPHILWQIHHGWPTLEFMNNARLYKNAPVSLQGFFTEQIMGLHPVNALVWIPGLFYLFFSRDMKSFRLFGFAYAAIFILFILQNAKPYYLGPFYSILFASGVVAIGEFIVKRNWRWLKPTLLSLLVVGGALTAPMALPVLPVETFVKYAQATGFAPDVEERHEMGKLPQHYADMFGWENMVATVAKVYQNLTPEEQAKCVIYCQNYGDAGAVDFLGKEYNLPKAISGHNNYWLWGPGDYTVEVIIIIGGDPEDYEALFEEYKQVAFISHEYSMPYENQPVYLCRKIKTPLGELWPEVKTFI